MKTKITALLCFCLCSTVSFATHTRPFEGWGWLMHDSSDILIVRCVKPPSNEIRIGPAKADVELISSLKGGTNHALLSLISFFEPHQGEYYLIFGESEKTNCFAVEEYRVVPLGFNFSTNIFCEQKTIDGQIKVLLQHRLNQIGWEIKKMQEEKARLEQPF